MTRNRLLKAATVTLVVLFFVAASVTVVCHELEPLAFLTEQ